MLHKRYFFIIWILIDVERMIVEHSFDFYTYMVYLYLSDRDFANLLLAHRQKVKMRSFLRVIIATIQFICSSCQREAFAGVSSGHLGFKIIMNLAFIKSPE